MKRLRSALQENRLAMTAELAPPEAHELAAWLDTARLRAEQADAIVIGAAPADRATVSALALAPLLLREGIDAIPLLDCRDRNRIALLSDLLGLRANGVSSLLLAQGSPDPEAGRPVFDMSRDELIAAAVAMNEELPGPVEQQFLAGITSDLPADEGQTSLRLAAAAGAQFLITEPLPDPDVFRRSMENLVAERLTWHMAVIATAPKGENPDRWREAAKDIPGVSGINLKVSLDD